MVQTPGHRDGSITMDYAHVLNRRGHEVDSAADRLRLKVVGRNVLRGSEPISGVVLDSVD